METTDNRQYIQLAEPAVDTHEVVQQKEKTFKDAEFWDKNKVKLLLTLCLEDKYRTNCNNRDKKLWEEVAPIVGTTSEECSRKYGNLRRTYVRLYKKNYLGKNIKWIHYSLCEEIFKDCKSVATPLLDIWDDNKIRNLLTLYIENLNRFRNPDCIKKDIWNEMASILGTTESSCYHKFKNLKRTYFSWLERNRLNGGLIKWPYLQYFRKIFYNYNPSLGPWNRQKVKKLLEVYAETAYKFKNPKFKKKELWKDIANVVGESAADCDRKFRNLKQTYFKLKLKADSTKSMIKWRYFSDFEYIYGFSDQTYVNSENPLRLVKNQEEDYVKQLLQFYIDNKDKFRDPKIKNKKVWKVIAHKINMTWEECDKKFRNLKQTYMRLAEKKKASGKLNNWPYFSYFEAMFDEDIPPCNNDVVNDTEVEDITLSEVTKIAHEVQERKDNDRKLEYLLKVAEESNNIQRERNKILQALLEKR